MNYHDEQAEGIFRYIYMAYVFGDNLYGRKLIKIPEPRFVVFYNGIDKMPEQSALRLSAAYESKSEELDLELRIRYKNINPGYNEEMVEKSPTLYQYVKFVDTVRKYQQEMPFPEAVEKAIDECIKKGILAEFLRKNRAEVLRVSIFEYDEEEQQYVKIDDNTYIFEGKTLLNDFYNITGIDENDFNEISEDAETLAGLILEIKEDFPAEKEKICYGKYLFTILEVDKRRIIKI